MPKLRRLDAVIHNADIAELTADGIRANLEVLRERLPAARILLLGLLPREEWPSAPLRLEVARVNQLIRDCADGEHIYFAEIGEVLLDRDGHLSAAIAPSGSLTPAS